MAASADAVLRRPRGDLRGPFGSSTRCRSWHGPARLERHPGREAVSKPRTSSSGRSRRPTRSSSRGQQGAPVPSELWNPSTKPHRSGTRHGGAALDSPPTTRAATADRPGSAEAWAAPGFSPATTRAARSAVPRRRLAELRPNSGCASTDRRPAGVMKSAASQRVGQEREALRRGRCLESSSAGGGAVGGVWSVSAMSGCVAGERSGGRATGSEPGSSLASLLSGRSRRDRPAFGRWPACRGPLRASPCRRSPR